MTRNARQDVGRSQDAEALAIEAPNRRPLDEVVEVRIVGADPGDVVEFEAKTTDAEGVVDLTTDAPESGTYEGAAPMGWRWSMAAEEEGQVVTELVDADAEAWPKAIEFLREDIGGHAGGDDA